MAIFRCRKCGHVREVGNGYIGKSVKCPKCDNVTIIYDTIGFLNALINKHITQTKELRRIQKKLNKESGSQEIVGNFSFDDIDIHNTNIFTESDSFLPIIQWFEKKNIQVQVNPSAVDTTGFFDEIALQLGNNFNTLSCVAKQIKYIQNKKYVNAKIELSSKDHNETQQITSFCKSLYEYSFVAKYFYLKKDNSIRLTLQKAPTIREFFNGIWMEWFTLMKLLEFFSENQITPVCARGIDISFSDGSSNELDIFFLTKDNIPICIECKTGEFRQDIDKYLSLRKRINIEKKRFIICVFGLSQEQTQGMTSMYDLTFVNENTLIKHIQTVV